MSQDTEILTAASQLEVAAASKVPCDPVRVLIGETSQEKAYKVQNLITQSRILQGANVIGKKIGLTSVKVQQQLGVDQPDFGMLFDDMEIKNGGKLSISETMQPKAEAEIAFVLKKDLLSKNPSLTEIEEAIDYAVAAIEIVGSRIANWDIKITDTIADNASASHFVLGDVKSKLSEIDVIDCEMQLFQNNQLVSQGSGAACLGSPLIAVQWLAKKMAEMNSPLKAGDIILSGALGPMVNVVAGDTLFATVEGLGRVGIEFVE
ncbi:MAG: fumarylacetoacetate hydrolase family protein [Flavobacteriaceae bacterium]